MTSYELTHFKKMVRVWKTKSLFFLFKIWPSNRFSRVKSYNFHFHKNYVTWPLSANGLFIARFASVPNFHPHTVDLWKVYHSHYGAWSAWSEASGVGDGWREGEWVRQVFSPLRHLFSSLHICPTLFSLFVSVFCLRLIVWTDNPQAPACFLIKLNNICGRHYLLKAKRVGQIHRCVRPCYYLD